MKQQLQCIKCGHRRLWVIDRVDHKQIGYHDPNPLVAKHMMWKTWNDAWSKSYGAFQAIICAQCGYTEWYAYQLEQLHELLADPNSGVRLVNSEPGSSGPFR